MKRHVTRACRAHLLLAFAALLSLSSCARPSQGVSPSGDSVADTPGAPAMDWGKAPPNTLPVDDTSVEALLSFKPVQPASLGDPVAVYVTDPEQFESDLREVVYSYNHEIYGVFWLVESPTVMTQSELEGLVDQCDPALGCQGKWSVVEIEAVRATLVEGVGEDGTTSVEWLREGVAFVVTGPSGTLVGDSAIRIVKDVIAAYD